ncbi:hypothetical protein L596_011270 [Steinernema carpocapsae]|uniref:Glycosyltransferase family 92 protein n=1 Tax=Steinernema carpocapsae TaxID=34508 RepID=A0A4V6A4F5_STECR|nr:hypothetical protein L596_011270 [Steinernema carpocapsae]
MRSSISRKRIVTVAFLTFFSVALLLQITISPTMFCSNFFYELPPPKAEGFSRNLSLSHDSLIIYRAYLDLRKLTKVRILAFSRCFADDATVKIGSEVAQIVAIEKSCPWKWAPSCDWNSFYISAKRPLLVENSGRVQVSLPHLNRSISISLSVLSSDSRSLSSGLSICVPPLYWFSNWPLLVHFFELWRLQGATHFFVYVHSVSVSVRSVLGFYFQKGLVTVVPWNELPSTTDVNPNLSLYRLGHSLAHNDCVFRTTSRFTALVDIDEFLIPSRNQTLLELLDDKLEKHPLAGSFVFTHIRLRFDGQDWSKPDFSWLRRSLKSDKWKGPTKYVFIADRTRILLNQVHSHFPPFSPIMISHEEAHLYHARSSWAAPNAHEEFEPIKLYTEESIQAVKKSFDEVGAFLTSPRTDIHLPNKIVSDLVVKCLSR